MEMMMDSICYIPYSLVEIVFILMVVNFVKIILEDCFFRLNFMILFFLHTFSLFIRKIWKLFFDNKKSPGPVQQQQVSKKLEENQEIIKPCVSENLYANEKLSIEEVNMTMEKLIALGETSSSSEIASLFAEEEVSLEEVKDAFRLFDENNDGFIDTGELRNVLFKLNFTQASEAECKKMINAFDEDRDGRIDFNEFVKLLESSLS
ncbi:hypothetical protein Patl1_18773 [Pistacia atlantica]|uniref:Uncharacterized protein n=1 Tax=Pistacia atlantica TaxID=434234 RepID=A0ACC1C349_9ROSI|nr:hypothetical protein Patl1_18773 [Pistacia atlantica]